MDITKKRLKELEDAEAKLRALESGGVDNWDFYDDAMDEYNKTIEHEKKLQELLEEIEVVLLEGAYEPSERGAGYATTEEAKDNALLVLKNGFNELYSEIKDE